MDSIKLLVLEELWRKEPHSKVFLRLAEELRKSGQFERAISVCKAGLPNHPGYVPALVSLGRSSQALGHNQDAENVFSQVLELSPSNTHALRGLGLLLADRGAYSEGLEHLETLLLHEPNDIELRQSIDHLKTQKKLDESKALEDESMEPPVSPSAVIWTSTQGEEMTPEDESSETESVEENVAVEAEPEPEVEAELEVEPVPGVDEMLISEESSESDAVPAEQHVVLESDVHHESESTHDDSLANLDLEFERAMEDAGEDAELFHDEDALTGEFDINDLSPALDVDEKPSEIDMDTMITRGLKHEKMEHLEQAEQIYRELLEHHPDDFLVREHLERVLNLLNTEIPQARKIRRLSNWLDKIKGVYHVS